MDLFESLAEAKDPKLHRHKKDLVGSTSFKAYVLQVTILENDTSGPFQVWHFMIQMDRSEEKNGGKKGELLGSGVET